MNVTVALVSMVELVKMQLDLSPVFVTQDSQVTDVKPTSTHVMESSAKTMEPLRLVPIHFTVSAHMVLLETDVKDRISVLESCVRMMEHALMEWMTSHVTVFLGTKGKVVNQVSMKFTPLHH